MAGAFFVPPYPQFRDDDGSPLALGSVAFFLSGTSTPATVYSDEDLSDSLGSTVDLDEGGRPVDSLDAPVSIWIEASLAYKVRVLRADATLVREVDPYRQSDPNRTGLDRFTYTADGALTVKHGLHMIEKSSAAAMTLDTPTSLEEGFVMHVRATTAFAHVVDFQGATATFGGAVGDGMMLVGVDGLWHVVAVVNVVIT